MSAKMPLDAVPGKIIGEYTAFIVSGSMHFHMRSWVPHTVAVMRMVFGIPQEHHGYSLIA